MITAHHIIDTLFEQLDKYHREKEITKQIKPYNSSMVLSVLQNIAMIGFSFHDIRLDKKYESELSEEPIAPPLDNYTPQMTKN